MMRRGTKMGWLLIGTVIGMVLGYKMESFFRGVKSIAHHGHGLYGDATEALGRSLRRSEDRDVLRQVRLVIGRHLVDPEAIDVELNEGVIRLRGSMPGPEIKGLIASLERLPGVRQVIDQMVADPAPSSGAI